ncbi:MAG TPA: ABC transporter permease, partial [Bacteroidales bacterium]|nr:ABC transporter permease [Bacteroidales bacterium]
MSKTGLIIQREYVTRVKKKSFIIMTILGPLLFAALMVAPALLAQMEEDELKYVAVIDDSYLFAPITSDDGKIDIRILKDTEFIKFDYMLNMSMDSAKNQLKDSKYYALLYIPHNVINMGTGRVQLLSYQQPNLGLKMHIANCLEKHIEDIKLAEKGKDLGITPESMQEILRVVNSNVNVITYKLGDDGEETQTSTEISMILGYISGFLIYMFVFMYGSMVMRGVIEEKTSRIVEVIVSSVKPYQLMMGKITGNSLAGILQ